MSITTNRLAAASGLCAAAAGAIYIGVQINHPHLDASSIQTTEMAVRDTLKVLMAALSLSASPACTSARSAATESSGWSATSCSAPATS
jgi:hypothetical protein